MFIILHLNVLEDFFFNDFMLSECIIYNLIGRVRSMQYDKKNSLLIFQNLFAAFVLFLQLSFVENCCSHN